VRGRGGGGVEGVAADVLPVDDDPVGVDVLVEGWVPDLLGHALVDEINDVG
jgi:hypothetical protein